MHPILDIFRETAAMGKYSAGLTVPFLGVAAGPPMPSHAQAPGHVSVVLAKAGLVAGAGGGRGALTYRGLGVTVGVSAMRLTGRVSGLRELKDFSAISDTVGAGGALVGGVQLTNKKGVTITLHGAEAGLEFAANRSPIMIMLK